jgi:hypothetical protein
MGSQIHWRVMVDEQNGDLRLHSNWDQRCCAAGIAPAAAGTRYDDHLYPSPREQERKN